MAKRKPQTRARAQSKPKAAGPPPIARVSGSPAFHRWLDNLSKKTLIPKAVIARVAITQWAAANGHTAPPES